jgi:hypothetical protein
LADKKLWDKSDIDPPSLFIGKVAGLFAADLHSNRNSIVVMLVEEGEQSAAYERDIRELYVGVLELTKMHAAFCPE